VRSFGPVRALDGLDLAAAGGEVVALVGPNGAGKTTLLLILAGLLAPDAGRVEIAGADPLSAPYEVRRAVGWMPDFFGVYDGLAAQEYLELFAAAYRVPASERAGRARELLELVALGALAGTQVGGLSRGQKQRLGFARALVGRPSVLLLDEPAAGLDPRARVELRDLVRRQRDEGACVLISSHILSELEEMADSAVFVDRGRVTGGYAIGDGAGALERRAWRLRALDSAALERVLRRLGAAPRPSGEGAFAVEVEDERGAADLVARLVAEGVRLVEAGPERGGLERAFLASGGEAGR
jgi:ABC-2 type transport system ATP-binding protein